jgi:hypothetical protein
LKDPPFPNFPVVIVAAVDTPLLLFPLESLTSPAAPVQLASFMFQEAPKVGIFLMKTSVV